MLEHVLLYTVLHVHDLHAICTCSECAKNNIDDILDIIQSSMTYLRMVGLNQFECASQAEDII